MPRTFTAAQILARVRELVDIESDGHWSDSEIYSRISSAYAKYYAKLVKAGLGYAGETTQSITSTGVAAYNLAADHFSTLRVDYQADPLTWWPLDEIDIREVENYQWPGSYACAYRLVGQTLTLYPTPTTGGTYRHIYVVAPADITTSAQTIDGVAGWEDAVVLDAAIRCLIKDQEDVAALMRERDLVDGRIEEEIAMRSLHTNRRIIRKRSWGRRDDGQPWDPSDLPPWR